MEHKVDERIRSLIRKHLSNGCDAGERRELLNLLDTPSGQQAISSLMDETSARLFRANLEINPEVSDRMRKRLFEHVTVDVKETPSEILTIPLFRRRTWLYAASLAGILLIAGWLGKSFFQKKDTQVYATDNGQRRTVILPDGSRVTLNVNSVITFDSDENSREISMRGEAFFDITRNPEKPLYVRTAGIEIKVLGTAFNVKSYLDDDEVKTTLIRGKVTVKTMSAPTVPAHEVELMPNEEAVFQKGSAALHKKSVVNEKDAYWHKGTLVFEDEPLHLIAAELEKWYQVRISIEERSRNCRFSMNIEQETLHEVLQLLEATNNAKISRNGNEIRISGNMCE